MPLSLIQFLYKISLDKTEVSSQVLSFTVRHLNEEQRQNMSLLTVETNMKMHLQMQLLVNLNKTKSPKNMKSPKDFLVGVLFLYFLLLTMVFKTYCLQNIIGIRSFPY